MSSSAVRPLVILIFFISGVAALAYEVTWTRQLAQIFGVTTFAVSTVLATYMGGLALGSYLFGRWIDRSENPLRIYAWLEIGIGLYALLVPMLFAALEPAYVALRRADLPYGLLAFGRASLAAGVLLPPTVLMGATFPVLTRFWVQARENVGRDTGFLYFVNTTGALVGCSLVGFLLLEKLGLRGTTWVAVSMNFAAGAVALGLSRRQSLPHWAPPDASDLPAAPSSRVARLALLTAGVSGFTSLAYEVLWSRALLTYLFSSLYAFTTMLTTFLAGIALGSLLYTLVLRHLGRPILSLGLIQVFVAIGFIGSSLLFPTLGDVMNAILGGEVHSFGDSLMRMLVGSALILLPPTVLLGATLPLATSIYVDSLSTIGRGVGRIYATNTFGSILGSVGAGFLLIPSLGMRDTLLLLTWINLGLGLILTIHALGSTVSKLAVAAMLVGIAAVTVFAIPPDFYARTLAPTAIFYREGATDNVAVIEVSGQRAIIYSDRRGTAGTLSFRQNYFLGHLPMLLHPGTPADVLHMCFGVGNSLSAVVAHESLVEVDSVELSSHVFEAAPYFWTNSDVIHDPKVKMITDDGRNFLMASEKTYDVITLEPPDLFTAGVINLFTTEFYEYARDRLADDGVMMQWIPTGRAPLAEERMLFRSFYEVFPNATVWQLMRTPTMLLIGSKKPLRIDYQLLRARMAEPRVARDLELIGVRGVDHFLSHFLFDESAFAKFVRDVEPITDDRTVVDFSMPRHLGSGFGTHGFLNQFATVDGKGPMWAASQRRLEYERRRQPVLPIVTNLGDASAREIERRIRAGYEYKYESGFISEEDWKRW